MFLRAVEGVVDRRDVAASNQDANACIVHSHQPVVHAFVDVFEQVVDSRATHAYYGRGYMDEKGEFWDHVFVVSSGVNCFTLL